MGDSGWRRGDFGVKVIGDVYAPDVSSNTSVTVRVTVTARGTGTSARGNTSDTDSEIFTVNVVTTIQSPGPVRNLTGRYVGVTAQGYNNVEFSWDAPNTGGIPTQYRYNLYKFDSNRWFTTTGTVTDLDVNFHRYTDEDRVRCRIRVEDDAGNSAWRDYTITNIPGG